MKTPKEALLPTKIDDVQDFESLREFLKELLQQMEEEHTDVYEDLKIALGDSGDMLKSVYDTNADGKVDDSDKVDTKHASDLKHGIAADDETAIKVKIGSFTCPAETGNYSVTGVGFKPRVVIFFVGRNSYTTIFNGQGWMDYSGNQGTMAWSTDLANAQQWKMTDACVLITKVTNGHQLVGSYVSMDTDGFTINFTITHIGFTIFWKAVR